MGYFEFKCPYEEKGDGEEKSMKSKGKKSFRPKRRNFQMKKSLFTLDSDVSDDESELAKKLSDNEKEVNLFMSK